MTVEPPLTNVVVVVTVETKDETTYAVAVVWELSVCVHIRKDKDLDLL